MEVTQLTRVYRYDGIDLPVPPHLAGDTAALRAYHATLYPAILNAEAVDLGVSNGALVTEYRRAVGTKGGGQVQVDLCDLERVRAAIDGIKAAFGAPGDHGYETREGKALFALYQARGVLPNPNLAANEKR